MNYIYLRVSSNKQEYDAQKNIIDDYFISQGVKSRCDNSIVIEEKLSGTTAMYERELMSLIENTESGDTIYVGMSSRFARNCIEGLWVLHLCQLKGVTIFDCDKRRPFKIDTMESKMMTFVQLWSDEQMAMNLRVATRAGQRKAIEKGTKMGGAHPKYGTGKDFEANKEKGRVKGQETSVRKRLNGTQLRTIIEAIESVIPDIKNHAVEGEFPFLGYGKYYISVEQWEQIHRTFKAIASRILPHKKFNKEASLDSIKKDFRLIFQSRFKRTSTLFFKY